MYLDAGTVFVDRPAGCGEEQHNDYTDVNCHQPSDEYDPGCNFEGMISDAQLGFCACLAIANADEMQTSIEGDDFGAERLKALEGIGEYYGDRDQPVSEFSCSQRLRRLAAIA